MIQTARSLVPEKVEQLYLEYPFDQVAMPMIRRKFAEWGIRPHKIAYQECFDAAMLCYMFSMSRCAMCGYENVRAYLKKMIGIAVILGLGCLDETAMICRENGLRQVRVDQKEDPYRCQ